MIREITIEQKDAWKYYIKRCVQYDFYHTWDYHSLDTNGSPLLFVYQEGDDFIAFPLVKREIPDSDLYDLTSVYGYAGPVSNQLFENMNDSFIGNFKNSFLSFLKEREFVSVFSRLNPFFNQDTFLEKLGGVFQTGKTVAIDLSLSVEDQRKQYKKGVNYYIRKFHRKGYQIKEGRSLQEIEIFAEIYAENMTRVNASGSYLFPRQYFVDLFRADDFKSRLFLVYDGEKAISGTIVNYTNDIIQTHLVATLTDYLSDSPSKMLIDEICNIARLEGLKYCHLGGGVGFKEDSLFDWKAGFSDCHLTYKSWGFIADEHAYNYLSDDAPLSIQEVNYFPQYRSTIKVLEK